MTIFLFIAKWFWAVAVSILLLFLYVYWYKEVVWDFIRTKNTYGKKFFDILENLETHSKIFISLHLAAPIIASFSYFLYVLGVFN